MAGQLEHLQRIEEGKELERCFEIPKSEWGEGPWQNEPDEFWTQAQGYHCALMRNRGGAWCGYVFLPKEHPWAHTIASGTPSSSRVHGGITFIGLVEEIAICSMVEAHWAIGFDMGHAFDLLPVYEAQLNKLIGRAEVLPWATYRTMEYAKNELITLATEARAAAGLPDVK